ncbi:MAG: cobalt-precorrin-5B (C(1))-methyltransferase CbiD, partial [Lachnospiraceae bacterium]|nr:cobalt-precorrin-5B (C(1))-methyltransferase CbiD [Lachnospiraceae bacterium]
MRYGFTTGSCAAAAAKAAAYMLLTGKVKNEVTIETPKGINYRTAILDITRGENAVSCAVEKDGGDDPDITSGAWIYANVSYLKDLEDLENCQESCHDIQKLPEPEGSGGGEPEIIIEGGPGIGRVTRPGLDQPIGAAAINRVPREMIRKEVLEVCRLTDHRGGLRVEIFVPEGENLCERTFNPRLGIVGGISILGTSGIVEPMSSQ